MEQIENKVCLRCGYGSGEKKWFPRKPGRPATCPNCSSAKWDQPKGKNEPGRKRIKTPSKTKRDSNG